jgi:hypothetical protein
MGICTSKSIGCAQGWVRATAGDQWCYKNYRYDACCCGTPVIPTTTVTTQTTRSPTSTATQTKSATTTTASISTTTTPKEETCCCCESGCGVGKSCKFITGTGGCANKICPSGSSVCDVKYCKSISHSYGKIGSVWVSQLTFQTKEDLWIVYGNALSRDNPVVIAENVGEVKYTPAQKGNVKILVIVFEPQIKVYKSNLEVTEQKVGTNVFLSCSQKDSVIGCLWYNCQIKTGGKAELTIVESKNNPSFTENIPVSETSGSVDSSYVNAGFYTATLTCENGKDSVLVEVK